MKAVYVYDEKDNQGPSVLLCEACIQADKLAPDSDWIEDDDWRCACCGATAGDDDEPVGYLALNQIGLAHLREILLDRLDFDRIASRGGSDSLTDEMLDAWAEEAERHVLDTSRAYIEIRSFDSKSYHAERIELGDECFDWRNEETQR